MNQMHDHPVNPVIFCGWLRYTKVFKAIGDAHHESEVQVNKEDLLEGFEALGLLLPDAIYR